MTHHEYEEHLYVRGFLATTAAPPPNSAPFFARWNKFCEGPVSFWVHPKQRYTVSKCGGRKVVLIGHAFNPYTMETDEQAIADAVAEARQVSQPTAIDVINQLTGLFALFFIEDVEVSFMLDASGMQFGCYANFGGRLYVASHMEMLGNLLSLDVDADVSRYINYKWFDRMMGAYLPGDLTAYKHVKRIPPNCLVHSSEKRLDIERIYPTKTLHVCTNEEEYEGVIKQAARILMNTMQLIASKWAKPAISLTGGRDSTTSFAAANGVYDRYTAFSYVSMDRESVDATAARRIASEFSVPHTTYKVPGENKNVEDFDNLVKVLKANYGPISKTRDNELRKRVVMWREHDFDIEVKSWIGETVRAYAYKYFGLSRMSTKLTARQWTTMYKIFLTDRSLARLTDKYFEEYIRETQLRENLRNYDHSDFFVWEMMHGGKCGLSISEMLFCHEITIPYNNRMLMDLLLSVPLEKRISDQHLVDMQTIMNHELVKLDIYVKNLNETTLRARAFNAYFNIHSRM